MTYNTRYGEARVDRGQRSPAYRGDPHWIIAKYAGQCIWCGATIQAGDRAFYYPTDRGMYCGAENCGGAASRDFFSAKGDEEGIPYAR